MPLKSTIFFLCVVSSAPFAISYKKFNQFTDVDVDEYDNTDESTLTDEFGTKMARNCDDLRKQGNTRDGEYFINAQGREWKVFCRFDEPITEQNWLVAQRRINADVDFWRNWNNYTDGFGDMYANFWLGLNKLHAITSSGMNYMIRFDLKDFENHTAWAEYHTFEVGGIDEDYRLLVSAYNPKSTAGNSFDMTSGQKFSTYDKDNDRWSGNCPRERHGAWWYERCAFANLNGRFVKGGFKSYQGIVWFTWKMSTYSLKRVEIKIRPYPM